MREQGGSGTPKRRFKGLTTDSDHTDPIAPNLLERNFTADCPNAVRVGDITYLRTVRGWVCLAVLIDLYSRKIMGCALECLSPPSATDDSQLARPVPRSSELPSSSGSEQAGPGRQPHAICVGPVGVHPT